MPTKATAKTVTTKQYDALCEISERIDKGLFEGELGPCMLTFSRHARAVGVYRAEAWEAQADGKKIAEIAVNPELMKKLGFVEILQTIVHEKCHQWQDENGSPSRNGYHNGEWGKKMIDCGLQPICHDNNNLDPDTGKVLNRLKRTGQHMNDEIIKDGPLDKFIKKLPKKLKFPFMGLEPGKRKKKVGGYLKYVCSGCDDCVRGKPGLKIRCIKCDRRFRVDA